MLENDLANPRFGARSEPLAEQTDWTRQHRWRVSQPVQFHLEPWFQQNFDKARHLRDVYVSLKQKDMARFPELKGMRVPTNGLEQVYSVTQAETRQVLGHSIAPSYQVSEDDLVILSDFVREKVEAFLRLKEIFFEYQA